MNGLPSSECEAGHTWMKVLERLCNATILIHLNTNLGVVMRVFYRRD